MLALNLLISGLPLTAVIALLGCSIVVVHRGTGVPNFAAGAIGMFGAYIFYKIWPGHGIPWPLAVVLSLACCAALGLAMHWLVMRRLRDCGIATKVIATLGLQLLLLAIAEQYFAPNGAVISVPGFISTKSFQLGGVSIELLQVWLVVIALAVAGILLAVQYKTRFGLATTAVCENETVAAGMGWSPDVIAGANWAVGSVIAGIAVIVLVPVSGLAPDSLTFLVVPALGAALAGRFDSIALTLVGAFVIGIGEAEVGLVTTAPGWAEAAPLLVIVAVLVVRGHHRFDRLEVVRRAPSVGSGRLGRGAVVAVAAAILLLLVTSENWLIALTTSIIFAVGMLSVVVITGYAGQLSLAQYGLAGISAYVMTALAAGAGLPYALAAIIGIIAAPLAGLVLALPALRTQGSTLAIATLSLVVVIEDLLLGNQSTTGWLYAKSLPSASIGGLDLSPITDPRGFAFVALLFLVLAILVVTNLRRSATGRKLLAIRTNPNAAASLGISPTRTKIYAFVVASAIAGLCGVLTEAQLYYPDFNPFSVDSSIILVLQATIGGIGWIVGALFGGLGAAGGVVSKVIGLILQPSNWLNLITGLGAILVILQSPDGVAPLQAQQMRAIVAWLRRAVTARRGQPAADPFARAVARGSVSAEKRKPSRLEVAGLAVTFGTAQALSDVSLAVSPGEIVGLIGPNGAGKSTFIEAACGGVRALGTVTMDGRPIDALSPSARAVAGLARSFQHLELFEDMTVGENLLAASERFSWIRGSADLVWPRKAVATEQASMAMRAFGLEDYLAMSPRSLDHGRRRMVAIARALATNPSVLLLDEPAAGLDATERRELGDLLRNVVDTWGIGILVVEHDVNLVFGVCDRVVVLVNGRVIASGTPDMVRADPLVREAYLGETSQEPVDETESHAL
jgi:ABC-type branched-subunit amino acid transport system ATPase component/branched-subunit amino acid ABC-type transport system permease component